MLDDETTALLEGGGALLVGSVAVDGSPHAARGWGCEILREEPLRIRVLLDGHDDTSIANLAPGRAAAVTAADVPTLRSVQMKGTSAGTGPTAGDDADLMARYVDRFFGDIHATDGTPIAVVEWAAPDPSVLVALVVDVVEMFDQTPGPGAGRPVGSA